MKVNTAFFDLDDTLIINQKINIQIIKFLYQCVNLNKKIILITKHKDEIKKTLNKYKICEQLFNNIIHLAENESKAKYVTEKNAIFIDDSFNERKSIAEQCGILTFDVYMIECLIEDRD